MALGTAIDRVIVSVDCGGDDYLAIMFLLLAEKMGMIIIQAIICGFGNTSRDNSCKNVARLLLLQGRTDIPLYRGSKSSILSRDYEATVYYFFEDGFGDLGLPDPDTSFIQKKPAAEAIRDIVNQYPNEISILALGPLTDMALAIKLYPDILSHVKELWIMGGNYPVNGEAPQTEFNFEGDPEAAHIVLETFPKEMYLFTWESALNHNLTYEWRFNIKGKSPSFQLLTRVDRKIQMSTRFLDYLPFDAITAATFIHREKFIIKETSQNGYVQVCNEQRGQIAINATAPHKNIRVIEEYNETEFRKFMIQVANMPR